ncbi:hypothetical protein [Carboxylicivirga sp. RSCT41]|uniref:hypothetical protein n=1 Tax=Carboxylicivirga agarovorans TaxID=3417570 RepID=UPI003D34F4A2
MKTKNIIILILLLLLSYASQSQSIVATKEWNGQYPEMNDDYPIAFICWKGWLPPKAHAFISIYPTQCYYYVGSLLAYDVKSYAEIGIMGAINLVLKAIDQNTLKKSMQAVKGIKVNQEAHEAIEDFLRQSRLKELPDIYQTASVFEKAYQAMEELNNQDVPADISQAFYQDIQDCLDELNMINQLDAEQGDKLQAMDVLNREVRELTGTIYYTARKMRSNHHENKTRTCHLGFLGSL